MKTAQQMLLLAICLMVLQPTFVQSQNFEGGLLFGLNNYLGDFNDSKMDASDMHLGFGIFARQSLNKHIAFRANLLAGKISGQDMLQQNEGGSRNYSFESSILEASIQVEWNMLVIATQDQEGNTIKTFQPYLFAGAGAVIYEPSVAGMTLDDPDANRNDSPGSQWVFPMGLGLQWQYQNGLSLSLEAGARSVNSDYLDGISLAGNPDNKDWYMFGGIALGFAL